MKCGTIDGVFPTIDFGVVNNQNQVAQLFQIQQKFSNGGPNVNSEFYTTWFNLWGDSHSVKTDISGVLRTLNYMNKLNASFSFYMIHGGSNFGFWSGAESAGPVRTTALPSILNFKDFN